MKRKRKQLIFQGGKPRLVDVPEDDILYRLDCHAEYLRHRSARFEISLDSAVFSIPHSAQRETEAAVEEEDLRLRLGAALSQLSPPDRQLIHLRFVQDLSQAQIAHRLGWSQQKVSRELHRIFSVLRAKLRS